MLRPAQRDYHKRHISQVSRYLYTVAPQHDKLDATTRNERRATTQQRIDTKKNSVLEPSPPCQKVEEAVAKLSTYFCLFLSSILRRCLESPRQIICIPKTAIEIKLQLKISNAFKIAWILIDLI